MGYFALGLPLIVEGVNNAKGGGYKLGQEKVVRLVWQSLQWIARKAIANRSPEKVTTMTQY